MIRKYELCISSQTLMFYVANNIDPNIVSNLVIKNIANQPYHFGIILNDIIINPMFDCLTMPLYSANNEYYILEVVHDSLPTFPSKINIYGFIFIDIKKLAAGLFVSNEFEHWLLDIINTSFNYKYIYIISDVTPFYYLDIDPHNKYINKFIELLMLNQCSNFYYISTDNDYYQELKLDANWIHINPIKLIMAGKMSEVAKLPKIFNSGNCPFLFDKFNYFRQKIDNTNGYVQFIINDNIMLTSYQSPNLHTVAKFTINQLAILTENINLQSTSDIKLFMDLIDLVKNNNYFNIYCNYCSNVKRNKSTMLKNTLYNNFYRDVGNKINHLLFLIDSNKLGHVSAPQPLPLPIPQ